MSGTSRVDAHLVDSLVAAQMEARHFVGLSVALVRGGRVEFVKGYGQATLNPRVPVDTGTRFAIGSVSDTITVAAQ